MTDFDGEKENGHCIIYNEKTEIDTPRIPCITLHIQCFFIKINMFLISFSSSLVYIPLIHITIY